LRALKELLPIKKKIVHQPAADDFASELERLFAGVTSPPLAAGVPDTAFSMDELRSAMQKLKMDKAQDEAGLVAELVTNAPAELLNVLLQHFNDVFCGGVVPAEWRKTLFVMLAKSASSQTTSDFRPIACARILYKLYSYLLLQRIEHALEDAQPEEQAGFRPGRRLEEHLLSATLLLEKFNRYSLPLWLVSLDLSKAFDRVDWTALWTSLLDQGVSPFLVRSIQNLYAGQFGSVKTEGGTSRDFSILSGVRQGCVLSPRLFAAVLHHAMAAWRSKVSHLGLDLSDGGPSLLDLRLADDILMFAKSDSDVVLLLDSLISELSKVGLILNQSKTAALTNVTHAPATIITPSGVQVKVLPRAEGHKWLGCILCGADRRRHKLDVEFHIQAAGRAFYGNRLILCNRNVSIVARLRYFASIVSSVACFAAGHRTPHHADIDRLNVSFRALARQVVGPPPNVDLTRPWHEILHDWHARLDMYVRRASIRCWGEECLRSFFRLSGWVVRLSPSRWVRRILLWDPGGVRRQGRPQKEYEDFLQVFCQSRGQDDWKTLAASLGLWATLEQPFLRFFM